VVLFCGVGVNRYGRHWWNGEGWGWVEVDGDQYIRTGTYVFCVEAVVGGIGGGVGGRPGGGGGAVYRFQSASPLYLKASRISLSMVDVVETSKSLGLYKSDCVSLLHTPTIGCRCVWS
jgi:hypothetical protein